MYISSNLRTDGDLSTKGNPTVGLILQISEVG
jgi:hypothetical protein